MRRILNLTVLLFALLALPSEAAIKVCNAARISAGDCSATSQTILLFAIDTATLVEFGDEVAEVYGYPTILCTQPDVTAGRCSSGQLGQSVATTETKAQFANRMLGEEIRRRVHNRRRRLAAAAAEAGATNPAAIE